MERTHSSTGASRIDALRDVLSSQRNSELAKVRDFRRDQSESDVDGPSDELEVAKSLADVELHANLIERSEGRLKAIDEAFDRLDKGVYGECDQCGNDISVERLKTLPFTTLCVDCQSQRERNSAGRSGVRSPFVNRWTAPQEMTETLEDSDKDVTSPEEDLSVRHSDFGPDDEELEQLEDRPRRRGRPRKNPLN